MTSIQTFQDKIKIKTFNLNFNLQVQNIDLAQKYIRRVQSWSPQKSQKSGLNTSLNFNLQN